MNGTNCQMIVLMLVQCSVNMFKIKLTDIDDKIVGLSISHFIVHLPSRACSFGWLSC